MQFDLHKNQQWAFIDGLLCGVAIAGLVMYNRKQKSKLEEKPVVRPMWATRSTAR